MRTGEPLIFASRQVAGRISIICGTGAAQFSVHLSPDTARKLAKDIQAEIDRLPRVASAADLGMEACDV